MKPLPPSIEFCCPECGGNYFRTDPITTFASDSSQWIGKCKGDNAFVGCTFQWRRSDDWKYFQYVQTYRFESTEELEAVGTKVFNGTD